MDSLFFIVPMKKDKIKHVTVKIKDSVAKSEHACWRMAILLYEIGHVIPFWTSTTPIYPWNGLDEKG